MQGRKKIKESYNVVVTSNFFSHVKENLCYDNNLPSGLQNVSNCKMNAPAFLSRPHFDKADRFYAKQFQIGVHPETEKHDSYFLIEPHTSIPLEVFLKPELQRISSKIFTLSRLLQIALPPRKDSSY